MTTETPRVTSAPGVATDPGAAAEELREPASDPAQADDPDRLAAEQPAHRLAPLASANRPVRRRNVAQQIEDPGERQFGDGIDMGVGRVEHGDAHCRRRIEVHIVQPRAAAGDDPQPRCPLEDRTVQPLGARDQTDHPVEKLDGLLRRQGPAVGVQPPVEAVFLERSDGFRTVPTERGRGDEDRGVRFHRRERSARGRTPSTYRSARWAARRLKAPSSLRRSFRRRWAMRFAIRSSIERRSDAWTRRPVAS